MALQDEKQDEIHVSSSVSGSIHSLLSTSSSQRRLRTTTSKIPQSGSLDSILVFEKEKEFNDIKLPTSYSSSPLLPISALPQPNTTDASKSRPLLLRLRQHTRLSSAFFAYAVFSVLYFSHFLYSGFGRPGQSAASAPGKSLSILNEMPPEYMLSKVMSLKPSPLGFHPGVVLPTNVHADADISACLWTEDFNLDGIIGFSSSWKGPISLLVTTTASPRSSASIALLARLEELGNMKSHKHRLAIHLLHLHANMNASPNTFLNIARLFSPTRFVMLFPVSLDNIPAPKLHEDLLSRMKSNITARDLSPTIVSFTRNSSATRFPYLRDTPLLLDRSHPIWCTERFFSVPSRSQDWDECLWLFWLKSFGGLHTLANPKWKYTLTDQSSDPVESGADSINARIHRRLSTRFRHETCVLAAKQLRDLSVDTSSGVFQGITFEPRTIPWLRQACKPVMSPSRKTGH